MTAVERINEAIAAARYEQLNGSDAQSAREFALVITHLEDAAMRFNRGMAFKNGLFKQADVEAEVLEDEREIAEVAQQLPGQLSLEDATDLAESA